jgi:hypothetical protein
MRSRRILAILVLTLVLQLSGCAHLYNSCDDKLLKRVPSPDGKLVLSTYYHNCRHAVYTTAALEKPPGFLESRGEIDCYLMSWFGRYSVDASWTSGNAILISTKDRLEIADFNEPKTSCGGVKITYKVQFRTEVQSTNDPQALAKLKNVLADVGSCIDAFYKAAYPTNDPVGEVNKLIDRGEHRSALELLLGYTSDASCAISPATYNSFKELSEIFDLKPGYLKGISNLVKQ